jgi:hypothetical protein
LRKKRFGKRNAVNSENVNSWMWHGGLLW